MVAKEDFIEYDLLKPELEAMKAEKLVQQPTPHGSSLDDEDMAKNGSSATDTTGQRRKETKNKAKMELAGRRIVNEFGRGAANGIDNLYHRRGMYEIGQRMHTGNLFSLHNGVALGVLKEAYDIRSKLKKGQPVSDVLLDSLKDMNNNAEGLRDGIYHLKSSQEYYKDFDYKRNRKKK